MRTPLVISSDGTRKAYAQIEAHGGGPVGCHNTIRLFVSTRRKADFRQIFMQKASARGGTANSLGPVGWSPNRRWLLVEFAYRNYSSDCCGTGLLLYDTKRAKVVFPDLDRISKAALQQKCSPRLLGLRGFDTRSRILLRITDNVDEGESQPTSYCFQGREEWVLNPEKTTMQPAQERAAELQAR